jgi:phosphoenolpyruvate phosphomutase
LKAIILAAGMGSRLGNLTKELPKPLIDVNGKSIIERQILSFRKAGINEITIVTGYKKDKFIFEDVEYAFNPKYEEVGQAFSLMTARKQISGDVIISFGDTIFEDKIIEQILNTKNDIVIGVEPKWREYYEKRMDNPPAISDFIAIKNGKIIKLFRNLKEFDEDCIITEFSGLFKLSAKGSKIITEKYEFLEQNHSGKFHDAVSLKKAKMIELLQELYENGVSMEAISLKGKWCEIDTPHDLEIAKKMFK